MRALIDTHTFLWFVTNDPLLGGLARDLIADPDNEVLLSPASVWEIAIKVSLGKYPLSVPFGQFIGEGLAGNGIVLLHVGVGHAAVLAALPMHHKDPFDRMIVAQALAESIPVISVDQALDAYGVARFW